MVSLSEHTLDLDQSSSLTSEAQSSRRRSSRHGALLLLRPVGCLLFNNKCHCLLTTTIIPPSLPFCRDQIRREATPQTAQTPFQKYATCSIARNSQEQRNRLQASSSLRPPTAMLTRSSARILQLRLQHVAPVRTARLPICTAQIQWRQLRRRKDRVRAQCF